MMAGRYPTDFWRLGLSKAGRPPFGMSATLVDRTRGVRFRAKPPEDRGREVSGLLLSLLELSPSDAFRGITCSFVPGSSRKPGAPNMQPSNASVSSFVSLASLP